MNFYGVNINDDRLNISFLQSFAGAKEYSNLCKVSCGCKGILQSLESILRVQRNTPIFGKYLAGAKEYSIFGKYLAGAKEYSNLWKVSCGCKGILQSLESSQDLFDYFTWAVRCGKGV